MIARQVAQAIRAVCRPLRRYSVVVVHGDSMNPALRDGDRVLVRVTTTLRTGQIVLVRPDPASRSAVLDTQASGGLMIKRLAAVGGEPVPRQLRRVVGANDSDVVPPDNVLVLGDHPCSEDSKLWGYLARGQVRGVVVRQLTRARS